MIETFLFYLFTTTVALTVLFVMVGAILCVVQPASASLHKLAWGGVFVASLLALTIPLRLPVIETAASEQETSVAAIPANDTMPAMESTAIFETPDPNGPEPVRAETVVPVHGNPPAMEKPSEMPMTPVVARGEALPQPISAPAAEKPSVSSLHSLRPHDFFVVLFVIWGTGFVVLLLKRLRLHWKLLRSLRTIGNSPPEPDLPITSTWQRLLAEHGLAKSSIPLLLTDSLGPALVRHGVRSYLLIPRSVCEELSEPLLDGLLRHELAHYLHHDAMITPVLRLLATLQWFQPLAWRTLRRYETAVEWSCDEFAYLSARGADPEWPGSAMLAETFLTVHRSTESLTLNLNTFARFNTLERVARLTRVETQGRETIMKKTLVLALLGLVFFCGMVRVQLVARESRAEPTNHVGEPSPASETTIMIRGKVVDESDKPVANANVKLFGENAENDFETTTDENGKFSLPRPEGRNHDYIYAIDAERTKIGSAHWSMNVKTNEIKDTTIKLSNAARVITGTVVDENGKPAKGILVAGVHQTACSEIVRTDEDGKYQFLFPGKASLMKVIAYQKGVGLDIVPTEEIDPYGGKGITQPEKISNGPFHLKLAKIEPVKIRIVDEEGNPMAGANVNPWLIQKPCQLPKPDPVMWESPYAREREGNNFNTSMLNHFDAIADENGIAVLKSVPTTFLDESTLIAYGAAEGVTMPDGKKRYYGNSREVWNVLKMKDGLPTMTLPRQGIARGSVKFEDGTPVPYARIALRWHNGSGGSQMTDENGEFLLRDNANTLYNIAVESDKGAAPAAFNFSVGDGSEEKQLDFTLKPGIKLFGTVTMPDGSPAEGFSVYIEEKDPNPPPSFQENRRDFELRRKGDVYTTDDASRYAGDNLGYESVDGKYEYLLPAVAREYSFRAVKFPSEKNSTQLEERKTNFRLMGNETEVRIDFHLKPNDPTVCDPEPELPEEVTAQQYASTGPKPTAGPNDTPTANPMIPENPVIKVLDENGKPFGGVKIEVRYGGDEGGNFNVTTDDQGIASTKELLDKKGTRWVVYALSKAGYVSRYSDWERPLGSNNILPAEVVYRLQKGVELGGIVVDDENRPIQGARVECKYDAPDRKNFLSGAGDPVTDAEGKWTTDMAPPGITKFRLDVTHPEYQKTNDFGVYPPYEQLQNKTAVVMLKKGITVKGTVSDPDGKPLAGAKICVTKFGEEFSAVQPVKTDEQGNYSIPNWREGLSVVYVACPGFAPDSREVTFSLSQETPEVDFQLKPGKTIKFKVLDQRGNPISEARVGPFRWRGSFLLLGGDELIKQEADENGNWEWTWAPDDEAEYSIRKRGYMAVRNLWLKPQDEPYVYRMNDPLEISGKVIDAVTKQPVMSFKQTTGDNFDGSDPKKASYWDDDEAVQRVDGTYRAIFTEPRDGGGHHVKIEADGYETYVSEMYTDSEGKVEQDVRLRKLAPDQIAAIKISLKVTVQTPDGKPAAGAQVGVGRVKDGSGPYISVMNGELDRCDEKYTADADGNITIPNFEGRIIIVATHASGVIQATDKTLEVGKPLELIPWARVEGTLLLGTRPGKNCQVELSDILGSNPPFGWDGAEYGHTLPQYFNEAITDENGKFVMERVAPTGGRKIEWNNDGRIVEGWHHHVPLVSADIELRSGQTTQATLGGKGVPVVGTLTMPTKPAVFHWNWAVVTLKPDLGEEPPFMLYNYPEAVMDAFEVGELLGGKKALTAKKDVTREQILEAQKSMTEYEPTDQEKENRNALSEYNAEKERTKGFKRHAYIDTEGRFRAENVIPGKYRVVVDIVVPKGDQRWESLKYYLGECTVKAEVPETPETASDIPVDLGPLSFEWEEVSAGDWQTRDWKD